MELAELVGAKTKSTMLVATTFNKATSIGKALLRARSGIMNARL
jgi:hypothetical protein